MWCDIREKEDPHRFQIVVHFRKWRQDGTGEGQEKIRACPHWAAFCFVGINTKNTGIIHV